MTSHRLHTEKLLRDVDRARRAGSPDEISYRQVAALIGVGSSAMFSRLRDGRTPDADALCSLLMWLNPRATLADYVKDGPRPGRRARRVSGEPPPGPDRVLRSLT